MGAVGSKPRPAIRMPSSVWSMATSNVGEVALVAAASRALNIALREPLIDVLDVSAMAAPLTPYEDPVDRQAAHGALAHHFAALSAEPRLLFTLVVRGAKAATRGCRRHS